MTGRLRSLLVIVAGAAVLSMGAIGWLSRDLFGSPSSAGSQPSLLELLEEVRRSPATPLSPRPRPAPGPPAHAAWHSPLAKSCAAVDPELQDRLSARLAKLDGSVIRVRIHPTNFGERFSRDAYGNPVDPTPKVIVLHETVYGIESAINTFTTANSRDEDQVSYHTLISQDGQIVEVLDPTKRAFGAGNSSFNGQWVITNAKVGGSINNFALHLSLETPIDGENDAPGHSGYTAQQYDAMAVVLADWMRRFSIPPGNITTHRYVDLEGARADPRSFDWSQLQQRLRALGLLC